MSIYEQTSEFKAVMFLSMAEDSAVFNYSVVSDVFIVSELSTHLIEMSKALSFNLTRSFKLSEKHINII